MPAPPRQARPGGHCAQGTGRRPLLARVATPARTPSRHGGAGVRRLAPSHTKPPPFSPIRHLIEDHAQTPLSCVPLRRPRPPSERRARARPPPPPTPGAAPLRLRGGPRLPTPYRPFPYEHEASLRPAHPGARRRPTPRVFCVPARASAPRRPSRPARAERSSSPVCKSHTPAFSRWGVGGQSGGGAGVGRQAGVWKPVKARRRCTPPARPPWGGPGRSGRPPPPPAPTTSFTLTLPQPSLCHIPPRNNRQRGQGAAPPAMGGSSAPAPAAGCTQPRPTVVSDLPRDVVVHILALLAPSHEAVAEAAQVGRFVFSGRRRKRTVTTPRATSVSLVFSVRFTPSHPLEHRPAKHGGRRRLMARCGRPWRRPAATPTPTSPPALRALLRAQPHWTAGPLG